MRPGCFEIIWRGLVELDGFGKAGVDLVVLGDEAPGSGRPRLRPGQSLEGRFATMVSGRFRRRLGPTEAQVDLDQFRCRREIYVVYSPVPQECLLLLKKCQCRLGVPEPELQVAESRQHPHLAQAEPGRSAQLQCFRGVGPALRLLPCLASSQAKRASDVVSSVSWPHSRPSWMASWNMASASNQRLSTARYRAM